mmetsp:Transcript_20553/g.42877  ORF Transcript_20553/g.42877 Transcript_20553/m.42877 type:complete len:202 (+) Transcript_20553:395-1000(+)
MIITMVPQRQRNRRPTNPLSLPSIIRRRIHIQPRFFHQILDDLHMARAHGFVQGCPAVGIRHTDQIGESVVDGSTEGVEVSPLCRSVIVAFSRCVLYGCHELSSCLGIGERSHYCCIGVISVFFVGVVIFIFFVGTTVFVSSNVTLVSFFSGITVLFFLFRLSWFTHNVKGTSILNAKLLHNTTADARCSSRFRNDPSTKN